MIIGRNIEKKNVDKTRSAFEPMPHQQELKNDMNL